MVAVKQILYISVIILLVIVAGSFVFAKICNHIP